MRSAWLVALVGLVGCAHAPRPAPHPQVPASSEPVSSVDAPAKTIAVGELGAEGVAAEWIELAMPADARVLGYERDAEGTRETWTLVEGPSKRLLRIRYADGQAAWVGTKTKEGMDLRLVEVRGKVRFAPERLTVTCAKDKICREGKPRHAITASMCVFEDGEATTREVAWFLPGKGVDFAIAACETENTTRERYLKSPLGRPSVGL